MKYDKDADIYTQDILAILPNEDLEDIVIMERKSKYYKCKSMCRNRELDPDSAPGFGYVISVLVSKFLGIKTCFDITGDFNYPMHDLMEHEDSVSNNIL